MAYQTVVADRFSNSVIKAVQQMTSERGDFSLVLLFPVVGSQLDRWAMVVSAPWLDDKLQAEIPYITSVLLKCMPKAEVRKIDRVTVLPQSDSLVQEISSQDIPLGTAYRVQSFALLAHGIEDPIVIVAKKPGPYVKLRQKRMGNSSPRQI
jgi:hypothetical protein